MSIPDKVMKLKDGKLVADQLSSMIAPKFDVNLPNDDGEYVTYNGQVYCLPEGHTLGVSWANTEKEGPTNIGNEVCTIKETISQSSGVSRALKAALLQIASKIAYIDDNGPEYYQALYDALYENSATLTGISVLFSPGNNVFHPGSSLNDLKQYITLTALYSDGTTLNVDSGYTLDGSLENGTNAIVVNYGGKQTTFFVDVLSLVPTGYTQLQYINTADGYADTGLNETEVTRAQYQFEVSAVYYTKGNHILSAMNTFFPYLSGSNGGGDYSQIRAKLKGSETISSGSASYTWSKNTIYTLEGFVGSSNNVLLNDETKFAITAGTTESSSYTYLLFATQVNPSDNGYRFHGRLYSMKIYGENDVLLRNYIPCINSSNVVGLYDTVTETFISSLNQNSAFTAGPTV